MSLLDALKDLAFGASFDKNERKTELERQKAEIETELARLEHGEPETLDSTKIIECYYGVEDAARRLLADFKQIEQNFRDLDRETKERVIASERSRGAVLKEVFEHRDAIVSSDQGKSFNAFWGFLMSMKTREEMAELIERVLALEPVRDMNKAFPLETLDNRLVSAGARVQRMTHRLNEELRFFLDERSRRESKRVGELIENFKRLALLVREAPPDSRRFIIIDGDPEPSLVMDRPLYEPEEPVFIAKSPMHSGIPSVEADALFALDTIDRGLIEEHIRLILLEQPQASLSDIVNRNPIRMGAAEILGYLSIASEPGAASDSGKRTEIQAHNEHRRTRFVVDSPEVIFLSELPR